MNKSFFGKIEQLLLGLDERFSFSEAVRFVNFDGNEREQKFASHAKVIATFDTMLGCALCAQEEDETQVFLVNSDRYAWNTELHLASPAEFLLFYCEFPVKFNAAPEAVYDITSFIDSDEYNGHSPDDLYTLFKPVFRFKSNGNEYCRSRQLADILIRAAKSASVLDDGLCESFLNFDYRSCQYELARLSSVLALGHRSQFLELYTILESMYFDIYCEDIYENLGGNLDRGKLFELLDEKIGWRPREIDALQKLVRIALNNDKAAIDEVSDLLEINNTRPEKIAESIYRFRNDYVHWRLRRVDSNVQKLNKYSMACLAILRAIPEKYYKHDDNCNCVGQVQLA
ncbi:hypothetical protein [Pelagibacterium halotolerans]|nr:hypothetical protein [Pelagibacterium halotolerans]QJR18077.1 hypothetical protein HKM20_06280 [Pelagibacterium halotolerans]SDZ84765.1 hypothetical protein SAMN05428936_101222 [Pelagibacterium halotolerans]